ncbi:NAD-dependent epimerase/dehydratase family protein [Paracoccus zhejiangensis]|uniref:Epimerase n=1 Tax=Paracoccus zhejiangensis TaxID=1077935 RepID=A0A2H5EV01_9RHOB|nr:NAD-dependent epimerase/dehydratase family protein [Paracoccus zhejiangensis]AUH63122.1 epimerase [Paracoccus zhejiangensis]
MSKTVLVTGGTGFIGSWCIVDLLKRGYDVRTTIRSAAREGDVRRAVGSQVDPGDRLSFAIADLTSDAGWTEAMAGITHVLHVASPLGREAPKDRDALIAPARDGTLRVLKAAVAAGVDRVILTSAAATARDRATGQSSEEIWADPEDPLLEAYRRSKILAERAAWDFMRDHGGKTTLTTIHPGAVFGPLLPGIDPSSVWLIGALLQGQPARLLNLGLSVMDVRDLAAAHVAALEVPAAPGQRYLCTGHFLWMPEIAQILRDGLGPRAAKVPTKTLPNALVRVVALFQPHLRMFRHDIGQRREVDHSKATRDLGFRPRPAGETLIDCAASLLEPRKQAA